MQWAHRAMPRMEEPKCFDAPPFSFFIKPISYIMYKWAFCWPVDKQTF